MILRLLLHIVLVFAVQLWHPGPVLAQSPCVNKIIIGQECWVHVDELDLDFLARVDTGATSTSLHAQDFLIFDDALDKRQNIGKTISFLTISTDGEYKRMEAEIADVQTVLSAHGRETRYMVWLTLHANGISKRILVNLRDRSRMRHKLLMGRDWLARDFLVDVEMTGNIVAEEGEEE